MESKKRVTEATAVVWPGSWGGDSVAYGMRGNDGAWYTVRQDANGVFASKIVGTDGDNLPKVDTSSIPAKLLKYLMGMVQNGFRYSTPNFTVQVEDKKGKRCNVVEQLAFQAAQHRLTEAFSELDITASGIGQRIISGAVDGYLNGNRELGITTLVRNRLIPPFSEADVPTFVRLVVQKLSHDFPLLDIHESVNSKLAEGMMSYFRDPDGTIWSFDSQGKFNSSSQGLWRNLSVDGTLISTTDKQPPGLTPIAKPAGWFGESTKLAEGKTYAYQGNKYLGHRSITVKFQPTTGKFVCKVIYPAGEDPWPSGYWFATKPEAVAKAQEIEAQWLRQGYQVIATTFDESKSKSKLSEMDRRTIYKLVDELKILAGDQIKNTPKLMKAWEMLRAMYDLNDYQADEVFSTIRAEFPEMAI